MRKLETLPEWWKRRTKEMWWRYAAIHVTPTSRGTWTITATASPSRRARDIKIKRWTNIEGEFEFISALHAARVWINEVIPDRK